MSSLKPGHYTCLLFYYIIKETDLLFILLLFCRTNKPLKGATNTASCKAEQDKACSFPFQCNAVQYGVRQTSPYPTSILLSFNILLNLIT